MQRGRIVTNWIKDNGTLAFIGAVIAAISPPAIFAFWLGSVVTEIKGDVKFMKGNQVELIHRGNTLWDDYQRRLGRESAKPSIGVSIGAIPFMWNHDATLQLAMIKGDTP